jgi:hypothetical protein
MFCVAIHARGQYDQICQRQLGGDVRKAGARVPVILTVCDSSEMLLLNQWSNAMKMSLVLIAGVALFSTTLVTNTASAGGVRVYVGPGYAYDHPRYRDAYPRYRYDRPRYRDGDDDPQGYIVYRVPKRYLRREARRYWRGW